MGPKSTLPLLFLLLAHMAPAQTTTPSNAKVVISQIYGGAGCGTANCSTFKNDYIEIYNRSTTPVSLNGYSVQYAPAISTSWQVAPLPNVVLQPGQYFLVAQGAGAAGVADIPAPDATGTIAMSATAAKVALVNTTTALSGSCPIDPTILDFVGYGSTPNCFEGTGRAPSPSVTTAIFRGSSGTLDANNNASDFTVAPGTPRNTSSPTGPTIVILPVTLSHFAASKTGNGVELTWRTSEGSELAASFTVERSGDGSQFTEIGSVVPSSFGQTDFRFGDPTFLTRTAFYRLKSIGRSGSVRYSGTVMVRSEEKGGLKLFPNPAQDQLQVSFAASGKEDIQVLEITGRRIKSVRITQVGTTTVSLDVSGLTPGTYFVQAGTERLPFVKM